MASYVLVPLMVMSDRDPTKGNVGVEKEKANVMTEILRKEWMT